MTSPVDGLRAQLAEKDAEIARLKESARDLEVMRQELAEARSWLGLMSLLDEHYPAEVFDGSSGDEGPRIVSLVRALDRAEASRRDWAAEALRLDELLRLAAEALCNVGKRALTVKPTLDKPYPDDPRWTPWTRFLGPAASTAYNLGVKIRRLRRASAAVEEDAGAALEGGTPAAMTETRPPPGRGSRPGWPIAAP